MAQTVGFSRALATVRRTVAARRDAKRRARAVRIPPCSPCIVCRKNKKQRPAGCCLWRRRWDSNQYCAVLCQNAVLIILHSYDFYKRFYSVTRAVQGAVKCKSAVKSAVQARRARRQNQAFFSTCRNTPFTAWAVWAASPVRVWEYTPKVSMSALWPTSALTSPAGSVFTTETKVCRSS